MWWRERDSNPNCARRSLVDLLVFVFLRRKKRAQFQMVIIFLRRRPGHHASPFRLRVARPSRFISCSIVKQLDPDLMVRDDASRLLTMRVRNACSGLILRSPPTAGVSKDGQTNNQATPPHSRSMVCPSCARVMSLENRGRRKSRMRQRTRSLAPKNRRTRVSHHRSTETIRLFPRDWF